MDTHLGAPARVCPACPDVQEQLRVVILPVLQTVSRSATGWDAGLSRVKTQTNKENRKQEW